MANSIVGDSGNNFLYGSWGDDRLEGLGGADSLIGMDGNDTLIGGAGDDTLEGGPGNDTFVFNRGDGQDVLRPFGALPGTQDRLLFGDGIAPADLSLKRLGSDLSIELRGTSDRVLVPLFFGRPEDHNGVPVHPDGLGQIAFADGMQWNRAAILTRMALDTAPLLVLGDQDNFYQGGGNLDAGAGNDTVDGYATYVNGGAGDDVLRTGGGPNGAVLLGGAGNDELRVGYGDALFDGGSGNDSLYGGRGNNTYVFSRGWGQDRLQLNAAQTWEEVRHSIVLSDLLPGAVALARSAQGMGNDLLITLRGAGDSLVLADYFLNRSANVSITFADGTVWGAQQVGQAAMRPPVPEQNGGSADDNLYGSRENDVLSGGDGNDQLQGMDGNDVLIGGNGNDFLSGGNGDDTLIPGPGFDHLEPGQGNNMILFGRENGQVVVLPGPLTETSNTIMMAADVLPAEVSVSAINSYQVLVRIAGSAATLRLDLVPEAGNAGPAQLRVPAQMQFADGTRWDSAKLIALSLTRDGDEGNNYLEGYPDRNNRIDGKGGDDKIIGGSGDDLLSGGDGKDTLHGGNGNDTLDGGQGDDILVAGAGNDLLRGGKGNDYLEGGEGDDTYVFTLGDGVAIVNDVSLNSGVNVLRFGAGISAADLRVVAAGPEQHLYYGPSGQIKLFNGGAGFGRIEFADGTTTTIGQLDRHAPVLQTPLNDADASAGSLFTMQVKPGIFTDADKGDVLTYKATRADGSPLPSWLKFDPASATFSGTPGGADAGSFDVLVTATDSTALSATDTFRMTVGAPNVAPTVRWPNTDMTIKEGSVFYKRLPTFDDANPGDVLTVTVTSADGSALPSWIVRDIPQDGISGSAGYDSAGTYAIKATATDKGGLSVSNIFNLIVTDVNRTPVLAKALPDAAASAGSAFALSIPAGTFADPDKGETLALSATLANGAALPQWLRFDPATAAFSGIPGHADSGVLDIAVNAADKGGLIARDVFSLSVADVNVAPAVSVPSAGATVTEGQAFSVAVPLFDDSNPNDKPAITLTLADGSALPAWMTYDPATGTISGTAGQRDSGSYQLKATATDKGGLTAASEFAIEVLDANHAPVLTKGLPDFSAVSEHIFGLTLRPGMFTDPDSGDVVTLSASLAGGAPLPAWLKFVPHAPGSGSFTGFPTGADVGSYELVITGTDKEGLSTSDSARLTIDQNLAPVYASGGAGATLAEGASFYLRPAAFTDPNQFDALTLSVTRADGSALPAWMSYDVRNNYVTGTAGYEDSGTYALIVTATDLGGLTASHPFDVTVTNTNRAPAVVTAIADTAASAGSAFTKTIAAGTFADPDGGDTLVLGASLADGAALPQWLRFDPASATFSGTPGHLDAGAIDVLVSARDQGGLSAGDTFRLVTTDVNVAPTVAAASGGATVAEGAAFSVKAPLFQDANPGDALTVAVTRADGGALPAWMAYDPAGGAVTGSAGYSDSGVYALAATATDKAGLSVSSPFSLTVTNTNRAPVLAAPLAPRSTMDNVAFSYSVPAATFADPDAGDSGVYSASALPAWLAFNGATRTFSGTPALGDAGTSNVIVRYTDAGGLAATATLALTVNNTASVSLTGTAGDDTLTGKSNNDTLNGLDGNDRLDGGLGADTMAGGRGNDSYVVDHAGDVVNEAAGAGTDSVASSIGYTLPANVENLTLTGGAAINGSGNTLNNTLTGNAGANVLNGGAGADSMAGNGGDDIYYVDNTGDVVTEWANGGFDQLISSVTRTLANNAEVLTLTGTLAINGSGNAGNNLIQGNNAANSLNGAIGYDLLLGGAGNDRLSDSSNESNLFHAGTGADTLFGGVASELFIGGTGNDNIDVQTGVDIIAFNKGDGQDLVQAYGGNDDTLSLGHGIAYADLALKKVGTDLVLMMGAGDQITFRYWFEARGGSVSTLQVITAGGADHVPGSASAINDNKVELFDFAGLVGQFNQARAANPSLTSWNMAQSMAAFSRGGSDTAAIGGDLAYHYAIDGDLSALGMNAGLAIIGSATFGSGMQTLLAGSALVDGSPMLY